MTFGPVLKTCHKRALAFFGDLDIPSSGNFGGAIGNQRPGQILCLTTAELPPRDLRRVAWTAARAQAIMDSSSVVSGAT